MSRGTDPFGLAGQTAVVTGGSRGLGLGMSAALLDAGADVVVMARNGLSKELIDHAEACGRTLDVEVVDLADREAIDRACQAVLERHRVEILVNNAGAQERHPAVDFPLEAWDRVLDVNLRSMFQMSQAFARPMLERGHGRIINVASLLSFQGGITVAAYAASKGGVAQLTKALCNEWAAAGVNVNAVAPGYMQTDMNEALLADSARLEQLSARIPAGRWGKPEDVGGLAVFLASPAAAYIHGQVIAVDGGWLAR